MQISFIATEILAILFFIICFSHALKRGNIYIIELIVAVIYGILLEILSIMQLHAYSYGEDFIIKIYTVPLAVGLAWATIIYTAMVTADRLGVAQKVRPFLVALLALSIDISMDPIAIREGYWNWNGSMEPNLWFGVPLFNFFLWFVATFSFSYFIYYFRKIQKLQKIYPFLAMILSIVILLILDGIWVYYLSQSLRVFTLVSMLFLSIFYVFINKSSFKKDNKIDWKILSVPFTIYIFFLILILTKKYYTFALFLESFLMLVVGLYVYLLPSFDILRKYIAKNNWRKINNLFNWMKL